MMKAIVVVFLLFAICSVYGGYDGAVTSMKNGANSGAQAGGAAGSAMSQGGADAASDMIGAGAAAANIPVGAAEGGFGRK
uniref:Orphan peptide AbOp-4 n=1 Tax=Androctonus bicolor TaxID=748906 RepID=A0A0K0LCJ6_9SCOR|nr:orphan peptide AbOp-4 [Androctonus bicolor]